jgi:hypothetical protein
MIATPEEHEHDGHSFDRHRCRTGRKVPTKIHGQELVAHAKLIFAMDTQRIEAAIKFGMASGDDHTDLAHRVIGSREFNGVNGVTEHTRQHISRLGRGLLHKRKTRMAGASTDGPKK